MIYPHQASCLCQYTNTVKFDKYRMSKNMFGNTSLNRLRNAKDEKDRVRQLSRLNIGDQEELSRAIERACQSNNLQDHNAGN